MPCAPNSISCAVSYIQGLFFSLFSSLSLLPFLVSPLLKIYMEGIRLVDAIPLLPKKSKEPFVLGPIPMGWVEACAASTPCALVIALKVLSLTGARVARPSNEFVAITEVFGKCLGISRFQRYRAIAAMEVAKLVVVERAPKRAPRIRLIAWKGDASV
jgi:hypothetical protein